jgi:hypothetical protein
MLCRVALVKADVSEERITSIIRVTIIGKRGTRLAVTINRSTPILVTLMMEAIRPYEISVLTRATLRQVPEDGILHSHAVKTSDLT